MEITFVEAFMGAFVEVTFVEAFMEASVEAFMEDSVEVNSLEASTKNADIAGGRVSTMPSYNWKHFKISKF